MELRIKDLLSQVAKYDKELTLVNHEKYLQLEMIKADSHKLELSHLDLSSNERNTINRKHQIFSYYNHGLTSYPFHSIGLQIFYLEPIYC